MNAAWNEYGKLESVAVRSPQHAYVSKAKIGEEWQKLRFRGAPDLESALIQHRVFAAKLQAAGAKVLFLSGGEGLTLDSIYARDALLASPRGLILCRMGRVTRRSEPLINARELERKGHDVIGEIEAPGTLEGGDFLWFDEKTAAVGLGPRTNKAGIEQLKILLGAEVELHVVPLPDPSHPEDVMHLMSMISPLDEDLAVVYRPLMPQSFVDWLEARGMRFIEVPEDEFPKMECNVLAIAPRHALLVEGCPKITTLMEDAGCTVETYAGSEISYKGGGGPTCLTRPLVRG